MADRETECTSPRTLQDSTPPEEVEREPSPSLSPGTPLPGEGLTWSEPALIEGVAALEYGAAWQPEEP